MTKCYTVNSSLERAQRGTVCGCRRTFFKKLVFKLYIFDSPTNWKLNVLSFQTARVIFDAVPSLSFHSINILINVTGK